MSELVEQSLSVEQVLRLAETLKSSGDTAGAVQLYDRWIKGNAAHPLLHAVCFNHGVVLVASGQLAAARDVLERAIALNPEFLAAYVNLGGVYEKLGAIDQAVLKWSALAQKLAVVTGSTISFKKIALKQVGRVLEVRGLDANAEIVLRQSLEIAPDQRDILQHFVSLRQRQCKWPVIAPFEAVTRDAMMRAASPLLMAVHTDDPMLHLASAWNQNRCEYEVVAPAAGFAAAHRVVPGKRHSGPLRIGYLSSDLREHAIGYLMAEMFELHDRKAVEVFGYYCGPRLEGLLKERIKASIEHWTDISDMSDEAAARKMADDGIHILVDVNGYTASDRGKVIALRPAPIIVNWLGFPGSMGSPYHHYIIADDWIIPEGHEIYFSEKVLRLPCYQPNDRKRVVSAKGQTRREAQLPEKAMVYCCFNGMHKITRFTFERWMTILKQVPGSVLWLLGSTEEANERLKTCAAEHGVAKERLIFAGRMPNADHLARYPLADLFLDTSPYGAHTTGSDAMWMGVPVLTLSGRSFASRVCGSTARSAGLGELVCSTPEEYVKRAIELGKDRAKTRKYRQKLLAGRDSCTLFNTELLVRRLEDLYRQMWGEFQKGKRPRPDLTNLDVYLEVGIEEDHEAVEVLAIEDYRAWYEAKLTRRHRIRPFGPDGRFWTAKLAALPDA